MAVALTYSESFQGAAFGDSLAGGDTGLNMGNVNNNSYTGVTVPSDKTNNLGGDTIYIRHDATIDPITSAGIFISDYALSGFTYGGADSAANDYSKIKQLGEDSAASGPTTKNNGTGLSGGIWFDMDRANVFTTNGNNCFDDTNSTVYIVTNTLGVGVASAFDLAAEGMVADSGGSPVAPSAAVAGSIGISGDTTLGEAMFLKVRAFIPDSETQGGIFQFAIETKYNFTA